MTAGTEQHPRFFSSFMAGLKRNWQVNTLFIVLVTAVAAIIFATSGIAQTNAQNRQLKRLVECQNQYNQINNERTRQLATANERESRAAAEVDSAFLALTEALVTKETQEPEVVALLGTLRDKLKAQKFAREQTIRERLENPVPPPPQALCGTTP